ncbi:MAG TPA: rod shape-determining protein MreC, partial [Desulfohalobiaceae bacterium]|nr:rod shape-determining protein MreC [Desulfohalobiaceae bacterium]
FGLILPLFFYLAIFTWNWKTGYLDRLSSYTGMEVVGWILFPGKWLQHQTIQIWDGYIDLVHVQEKNEQLQKKLKNIQIRLFELKKEANEAERLRKLLNFSPPKKWHYLGCRIMAHRLGANAVLETLFVNRGQKDRVSKNMPVLTPQGIIGRVYKTSFHYSTILLLTDPNSHIPVIANQSRTKGILIGQGNQSFLKVNYIPQNAPLYNNELLVTSGLAEMFPKGLPVAQIKKIEHNNLSLFKSVYAKPLVNMKRLEETFILLYKSQISQPKIN